MHHPAKTAGFTIVELMVTLAVVAILATIAAPSFTTIIQDNRLATQINELQASLALARSEAIKLNDNVTLCSSNNGAACNGNWEDGWIAFVDSNTNCVLDGIDPFHIHNAISGNNTLRYSANCITYLGTGLLDNNSDGAFTLCDDRGNTNARGIVISATGRPALAVDDGGDGIVEDELGGNLVCPP